MAAASRKSDHASSVQAPDAIAPPSTAIAVSTANSASGVAQPSDRGRESVAHTVATAAVNTTGTALKAVASHSVPGASPPTVADAQYQPHSKSAPARYNHSGRREVIA